MWRLLQDSVQSSERKLTTSLVLDSQHTGELMQQQLCLTPSTWVGEHKRFLLWHSGVFGAWQDKHKQDVTPPTHSAGLQNRSLHYQCIWVRDKQMKKIEKKFN
jgi:hypothetical protein